LWAEDADPDHTGQEQAFGIADLCVGCRKLGYISIPELLEVGAELDFYHTPKTVAEILGRCVNPVGGPACPLISRTARATRAPSSRQQPGTVFSHHIGRNNSKCKPDK
jgi:hypothetical protein